MSSDVLQLYKMVGAGNDFLFVNLFDSKVERQVKHLQKKFKRPELSRRLCRRNESWGADGIIFIGRSSVYDFEWDFYNSDGSTAEMCGNAARCAILFSRKILGIKKNVLKFKTKSGVIKGKLISSSRAQVFLPPPRIHHEGLELQISGKVWQGIFVNTGVPHFVTKTKFKHRSEIDKQAALLIQKHKIFGKQQTNVTFMEILKKNRIRVATFERGVGDFTKACGTGAVAAAYAVTQEMRLQEPVHVEMPGGELSVKFDNSGTACLEGGALLLGEARVLLESLYGAI